MPSALSHRVPPKKPAKMILSSSITSAGSATGNPIGCINRHRRLNGDDQGEESKGPRPLRRQQNSRCENIYKHPEFCAEHVRKMKIVVAIEFPKGSENPKRLSFLFSFFKSSFYTVADWRQGAVSCVPVLRYIRCSR
jgi:hypothetical protein